MLKRFGIKNKKNSGFTIIELMIVIAIIAILAGIVFISYRGITNKAKEVSLTSDMSNAKKALAMHYAEYGRYPDTIHCDEDLDESNICVDFGEDNEIDYDPDYDFDDDFDELYDDDGYRLIGRIKPFNPSVKTYIATDKTEAKEFSGWLQISAGQRHTCGIYYDGRVYCWGDGKAGALGNGRTDNKNEPTPVSVEANILEGKTVRSISAGGEHTCAVTSNGKAYCWGWGDWGQLGNNSENKLNLKPVEVLPGDITNSTIKSIATGWFHTCALTSDGKAYCWGQGYKGQLGISDSYISESLKPAVVLGGEMIPGGTIKSISAGGSHTCAIDSYNQAYCWGDNSYGQIAREYFYSNSYTPYNVGGDFKSIDAGRNMNCARASNNKAYCWGNGSSGEMGNNTTTEKNYSPVEVLPGEMLSGQTIVSISSGAEHNCALVSDGKAYCWGGNYDGQLGKGDSIGYKKLPTKTLDGSMDNGQTIKTISSGDHHTCVIASDDQAYCWGKGTDGQIGDGLGKDKNITPRLVTNP